MSRINLASSILACMAIGLAFTLVAKAEGELSEALERFRGKNPRLDVRMLEENQANDRNDQKKFVDQKRGKKQLANEIGNPRGGEQQTTDKPILEGNNHGQLESESQTGSKTIDSTGPSVDHGELVTEFAESNEQLEIEDKLIEKPSDDLAASRMEANLEVKAKEDEASHKAELSKPDESIAQLNKVVERLTFESESRKNQIDAHEATIVRLEADKEQEAKANKEREEREKSLMDQLERSQNSVSKLTGDLETSADKMKIGLNEKEQTINSLKGELELLKKESKLKKDLEEQLKQRDETIEKQMRDIEELKSKMLKQTQSEEERAAELEAAKEFIEKIEIDREKLEALSENLQNNLKYKTDEHTASLDEIKERDRAIQELRSDIAMFQSDSHKLRNDLTIWSNAHTEKEAELEKREATIRELRGELDEVKSSGEKKVKEMEQKSEALEIELGNLRQTVQSMESESRKRQARLEIVRSIVKEFDKNLVDNSLAYEHKVDELNKMEEKLNGELTEKAELDEQLTIWKLSSIVMIAVIALICIVFLVVLCKSRAQISSLPK